MRVEEQIRLQLVGSLDRPLEFQHEGPNVVRWITTGPTPTASVVFVHHGNEIAALCPNCRHELGRFDADYGKGTYQKLGAIRDAANHHYCQ